VLLRRKSMEGERSERRKANGEEKVRFAGEDSGCWTSPVSFVP